MENTSILNGNNYNQNGFNDSSCSKKQKTCGTGKVICDPVHGQIYLHPACVAIIDTHQFQRLRSLRQTGFLEYVFPGATQTRFSHSLGVCFLAGKFIQELQDHQSELQITEVDKLCVQIAALCHDMGHGPFSHTWEMFMKHMGSQKKSKIKWKHEIVSINMFDYMVEENKLAPLLQKYGIGEPEFKLIKDFILGIKPKDGSKAFLYQIVNNDDSGLDVDKWDYFLRDCHYLGLPCSFEYERLIQHAKVCPIGDRNQICFRDKVLESVYNMFRTRSNLHRQAYQHKKVIILENMFIDAFAMADDKATGPTGEILQLWKWSMLAAYAEGDALRSALEKFCMLRDSVVLSALMYSPRSDLQRASNIVKAVEKRSKEGSGFYRHVGLKILTNLVQKDEILNGLCLLLPTGNEVVLSDCISSGANVKDFKPLEADELDVSVKTVNWGKGDRNPVDSVHFYSKESVFTNHSSAHNDAMLPKSFQEVQVHVICRRSDDYATQVARWCFDNYWGISTLK